MPIPSKYGMFSHIIFQIKDPVLTICAGVYGQGISTRGHSEEWYPEGSQELHSCVGTLQGSLSKDVMMADHRYEHPGDVLLDIAVIVTSVNRKHFFYFLLRSF